MKDNKGGLHRAAATTQDHQVLATGAGHLDHDSKHKAESVTTMQDLEQRGVLEYCVLVDVSCQKHLVASV